MKMRENLTNATLREVWLGNLMSKIPKMTGKNSLEILQAYVLGVTGLEFKKILFFKKTNFLFNFSV